MTIRKRAARPAATRRPPAKRKRAAAGSLASRLPAATPEEIEAARRKYEEGIISRGEAVPPGAPLTPGATHEITRSRSAGRPRLRRRRVSLK